MDTKQLIANAIFALELAKRTIQKSRNLTAPELNKNLYIDSIDDDVTRALMLFAEAKGVESVKPTEVVSVDDLQGRN